MFTLFRMYFLHWSLCMSPLDPSLFPFHCLLHSSSCLLIPSFFLQMAAEAQVTKLMEMGFNREDVVKALSTNSLNFENALGEREQSLPVSYMMIVKRI